MNSFFRLFYVLRWLGFRWHFWRERPLSQTSAARSLARPDIQGRLTRPHGDHQNVDTGLVPHCYTSDDGSYAAPELPLVLPVQWVEEGGLQALGGQRINVEFRQSGVPMSLARAVIGPSVRYS